VISPCLNQRRDLLSFSLRTSYSCSYFLLYSLVDSLEQRAYGSRWASLVCYRCLRIFRCREISRLSKVNGELFSYNKPDGAVLRLLDSLAVDVSLRTARLFIRVDSKSGPS